MLAQQSSRRTAPRIELKRDVLLWTPDLAGLPGSSANISASGMFVRTRNWIPAGRSLNFELLLAGGERLIRGEGEVVWRRQFNLGAELPGGLGIRFLGMDEVSQQILQSVLSDREDEAEGVEWREPLSGLTRLQRERLHSFAGCAVARPERSLLSAFTACLRWRHGQPV